jgi:hypothetical protein
MRIRTEPEIPLRSAYFLMKLTEYVMTITGLLILWDLLVGIPLPLIDLFRWGVNDTHPYMILWGLSVGLFIYEFRKDIR